MRLTGSGFTRAEMCPPSTFLPGVEEESSEYAKLGSAVHRYLQLVAEVGATAALELIDVDFRDVCAAIDLAEMPHSHPENWAVEVAFAWDWLAGAGRELYRGSGARVYGALEPTEVAGTADLVGIDGDAVVVLDLKTGWTPLGAPEESLQLAFYAVAAALAFGKSEAVVGFVRLVDGEPRFDCARLDEFALAEASLRLAAIVEQAMAAESAYDERAALELVAGEHCKYCRAFLRCPAKSTLLRELTVTSLEGPDAVLPVIDAAQVPAMIERVWASKELLARVEKQLEEYATAHPVRLSDGRIYGAVESSKETFDPEIGAEVLEQTFGAAVATEAVEVTTSLTKARLLRALRRVAEATPGQKITHLERQAHEAIRAAGGAKTSTWKSVKAFRPKLTEGSK